jgi:hypothetical protein
MQKTMRLQLLLSVMAIQERMPTTIIIPYLALFCGRRREAFVVGRVADLDIVFLSLLSVVRVCSPTCAVFSLN